MSLVLIAVILIFRVINNDSVIAQLFTAAGYTYGPLLGLYAFGLFTKLPVRDREVPYIAVASPILSFILDYNSADLFNGYEIGFEILLINGAITYFGLWLSSVNNQMCMTINPASSKYNTMNERRKRSEAKRSNVWTSV